MEQELQRLGLSYYESKAVCALLKAPLSLRQLSRTAKIPFGKVYSITQALVEQGIAQQNNSRPKVVRIDQPGKVLRTLIKKKQEDEQALFASLRRQISSIEQTKGIPQTFFSIGTTVQDNQMLQLRAFIEAEHEVCQIINIHHKPQSNRKSKLLWEKTIIAAVQRGVTFKAIYPLHTPLPPLLDQLTKKQPKQFQVKRLDTDFARCDIIDRGKILIKLIHQDPLQFGGIILFEDEAFAKNLYTLFQQFWEQAIPT